MLVAKENRNVESVGEMQVARATIKASPKIFNFFADQTYANKPVAICRELVANAVDSHVMAGKPKLPVEVWLPTLVDPIFKVRDHGLGMSHEFMMGQFMAYTDGSTKDQSNIAIGGFGIGSKSPFAYTDQYAIKSVHGGVESIYSVFKDSDGIPSIALMSQRTTSEPNGVEVSFPVEVDDFKTFEEAAFKALRYFDPLPNVINSTSGAFEPVEYATRGKMWGMRKTAGELQVIMGGIMYPVTKDSLNHKFKDDTARKILNFGLDIFVPIGTCSIALSREALSYDDQTIANLEKACLAVVDEVANSFSTMFDQHPSMWDAQVALFNEVYPTGSTSYYHTGGTSIRGGFLADRAVYKGKSLEMQTSFMIPGGFKVWELDRHFHRRGGKTVPNPRWEEYEQYPLKLTPGKYEQVIIDDLPRSPKSKAIAKIKEYIEDNCQQDRNILIIRAEDDSVKASKILGLLGDPTDYILTSSMPEPQRIAGSNGLLGTRPKVRMFRYDGVKRYQGWSGSKWHDTLNPGPNGKAGVTEIADKDQPDKGIYVELDQWKPVPSAHIIFTKLELGLVDWTEVHFISKGDVKKLDLKKWKSFEKVFDERLKRKLGTLPDLATQLAVQNVMDYHIVNMFASIPPAVKLRLKGPSVLATWRDVYEKYVKPLTSDQKKFASYVTPALPKGLTAGMLKLSAMSKHKKAHRLLELLDYRIRNQEDADFVVSVL